MDRKSNHYTSTLAMKTMVVMTAITLVLSLFLCLTSWQNASTTFSQMATDLHQKNFSSVYIQVESMLSAAQDTVTQLIRHPSFRSIAVPQLFDEDEQARHSQELDTIIGDLLSVSYPSTAPNITLLNIYMKNGYKYETNSKDTFPYRDFESCCELVLSHAADSLDSYIPTTWLDTTVVPYRSIPTRSILGIRFIYDSVSMEKIGVIIIGIKEDSIRNVYEQTNPNAKIVRADGYTLSTGDGNWANSMEESFSDIENVFSTAHYQEYVTLEDGSVMFVHKFGTSPCYLLYPINQSAIQNTSAIQNFLKQALTTTAVALAVTIALVWLSTKTLTKSLTQLRSVVQDVYNGNLKARFSSRKNDDIAYLGNRINDMLTQVEDSFQTQKQNAEEKLDLELQLMQAQINPHLLYNTLNSAVGILRQNEPEKAERLILSLGSFFKLALSRGVDMLPLSEELNMIHYYVQVQNLGRAKSFQLETNISDELRSCKLLRMTLQPFVENAVIHGFSDWRDDGTITINAREENEQLVIEILDNGIGILPAELESLLADTRKHRNRDHVKHYGIYNVSRRIKNKFGNQYGVELCSEVGCYTQATIRIPIIKEN